MKQKLQTFKIIHIVITLGTIIAYFVLGDLIHFNFLKIPEINSSSIIYLVTPIIAYGMSNFLFNKQLQSIDSKLSLEEKLHLYQSASIVRWAILEGCAFLILFLNPEFLIMGILIILYLIFLRPTEDKIKTDLNNYSL